MLDVIRRNNRGDNGGRSTVKKQNSISGHGIFFRN
jgi:hypothetical protein